MKLPSNLWKSPVIQKRLFQEACFECAHGQAEKLHYWVVVPQADTKRDLIEMKNFEPDFLNIEPHELQMEFASNLQRTLQREVHFDGIWVVGYTHPPAVTGILKDQDNCWGRLIMIWLDKDGDPQYTLESDRSFINVQSEGVPYWITQAEKAHTAWSEAYGEKAIKSDFMLKEHQMKKEVLESLN